ncbi:MAG: hypothetical protein EOP06_29980, partial [Proteobacteria bacterium]
MRFHSINSQPQSAVVPHTPSGGLTALLEAGSRLASTLPLYAESQAIHPIARLASVGVVRAQVRLCLAALDSVNGDQLTKLRELLGKAVRAINTSPNEATARAIFNSAQTQNALWAWAGIEAGIFIHNMTKNAPIDADKQNDLVGDAVTGFIREDAKRAGETKLHPFSMARTWDQSRMPDPLGTLRKYLQAWCKNVVQRYYQQQIHEGVSLDAPTAGANDGVAIGDMVEDRNAENPEAALLKSEDHQSKVVSLGQIFQQQIAALNEDIRDLSDKTDSYSVGQRTTLQNRLDAIRELVAPLLERLQQTSDALSATESDYDLTP